MRTIILLLALLSPPLLAQAPAPRFMYVYRDSLKRGVDSAYRVIEDDGAQICADLRCPNPYIGVESLSGPHEAWWINVFATEADTARVANVYATNRALSSALGVIAQRKAALIGTPIQGFAVYRPDLSRGPAWSVAGARFIVVTITRDHRPTNGSVWAMADSTLYVLRPVHTRREGDAVARQAKGRVLAVRPNWSMPAPEWVAADAEFWRSAPVLAGAVRVSHAQLHTSAPCDVDAIRRRVCAVDDSLGIALIRADTSALGRLYANDLVSINYRGVRSTKTMLLAAIAAGRLRFDTLQARGRSVEVYGDTVLLVERMHQAATGPEGRHPAEVDYRRTYVRREDRWQLVAAVIGVAPPP